MAKYTLQTRVSDTLNGTMTAGASSCTLLSGSFGSPTGQQIITLDYDVAAKAADFLCTIVNTAVTSMTRLNGPDVEHTTGANVAMCFVDEHYSLLMDTLNDGWLDPKETWAYASATTITVPSGAASRYAVGDKIKLTQTTVKYFYVVGVADTVLTVTGGTDYTVANAAITANYYSKATSPVGFPTQGFTVATNQLLTMQGNRAEIRGWGYIAYNTGAANVSATVTYGRAFVAAPRVLISFSGDDASSTDIADAGNDVVGAMCVKAHTIATTTFVAHLHTAGGANFSSGNGFFTWVAIGSF